MSRTDQVDSSGTSPAASLRTRIDAFTNTGESLHSLNIMKVGNTGHSPGVPHIPLQEASPNFGDNLKSSSFWFR